MLGSVNSTFLSGSNINLLDNWMFKNPMNQRNASSYSADWAYTIDRWILYNASNTTLNILSSNQGVSLVNNQTPYDSYITQWLPANMIVPGRVYTLSLLMQDGTLYSVSGILNTAQGLFYYTKFGQITVWYDANNLVSGAYRYRCNIVVSSMQATGAMAAIKLEVGPNSTLLNDLSFVSVPYNLNCFMYALRLEQGSRFRDAAITANWIDFFIPTPIKMRGTPTFTGIFSVEKVQSWGMESGFTMSFPYVTYSGVIVRATKTNHGLSNALCYAYSSGILSADLYI